MLAAPSLGQGFQKSDARDRKHYHVHFSVNVYTHLFGLASERTLVTV